MDSYSRIIQAVLGRENRQLPCILLFPISMIFYRACDESPIWSTKLPGSRVPGAGVTVGFTHLSSLCHPVLDYAALLQPTGRLGIINMATENFLSFDE